MHPRTTLLCLVIAVLATPLAAHNDEQPPAPPIPVPPTFPPSPVPSPQAAPGTPTDPGGPETLTPGSVPATGATTEDRSGWERWWVLNRHRFLDFLEKREQRRRSERSGAASHFFGEAGKNDPGDVELRKAQDAILGVLLEAAKDKDVHVATSAIIALGKSGDARARETLRDLAGPSTKRLTVRESALLAMGMLATDKRDVRADLTGAAGDKKRKTSERAYAALGLGFLGDSGAVPGLMGRAWGREGRRDVPALSYLALGLIGDEIVVPDLVRGLANESEGRVKDDVLRACVAAALAKIGSRAAIPSLLRALDDRDKDVRRQAVLSLAALLHADDAQAIARLLGLLGADRDSLTRGLAAVTLGEIGAVKATDALLAMYEKGDSVEAPYAALGLALLAGPDGDAATRERILTLLRAGLEREKNPITRGAIAIGLGLAEDRVAVPMLGAIVPSKEQRRVRAHAAVAVGMLGAKDSLPDLRAALLGRGDHLFRREIALAIGLIGDADAAREMVRLMRKGTSEYDRGSAALALGYLLTVETATPLVEVLGNPKNADTQRTLAAVALGIVVESRRVPVLSRLGSRLNPHIAVTVLSEALRID